MNDDNVVVKLKLYLFRRALCDKMIKLKGLSTSFLIEMWTMKCS